MHFKGRSYGTPEARTSLLPLGVAARLNYLRVAVAVAYACGMLLSPGLWFGVGRTFPRAPLLSGLPAFLSSYDYLLSSLLLAALALAAVSKRPRRYLAVAVALTVLLVILDQTRLQPWVYQYLVMLVVLACERRGAGDASAGPILVANQLVISTLYFWSGAQKLNWSFGHEVIPALLVSAGIKIPAAFIPYLPVAGIGVALCEALIGIALLVRRTRQVAVLLALGMHLIVLLMLVAASRNSVVWGWNIALMLMVVLLFWRCDYKFSGGALRRWRMFVPSGRVAKAVIVVCGLAPALSFVGWWDMYLSAALYSGNTRAGVMRISERVHSRLPATAQQQVFQTKRGELMLPFYEWSLAELKVPPYPEARVYRSLARQVCAYAEDQQEIQLIVRERPSLLDGSYLVSRADCTDLLARKQTPKRDGQKACPLPVIRYAK